MKHQITLFAITALFFICSACGNKSNSIEQTNSRPYPHIDTITIGLQSDSGHYATLTYYKKYIGKDSCMMEGAEFTKFGNEKWKVVTTREQRN